ncbi:sigma-70 family RNA polymerase sigma factor [Niallia alba]|uniref:sigma-70 family RNA polymerase sigma factor n=1 Tax=Niallia alba TaxID=2729105 RepID=UPI002E240820|nr:sigma-70 family RNA polymerase sigma factor [Niallia alba]
MNLTEMTNEELIALYRSSNDEYVKEYFFEKNINIAHYIANPYIHRTFDKYRRDCILSEVYLGLVKAFNNFDINKGCKFTTFADRTIRGELWHYFRSFKRGHNRFNALSTDEHANRDKDKTTVGDTLKHDNVDVHILLEVKESLHNFLIDCNTYEKEIYKGVVKEHRRQQDIANELGISQKHVSVILKKIKKKLHTI